VSSTLTGEELAAQRRRMQDAGPLVRSEIQNSIEELLAITRNADPLHLLGGISTLEPKYRPPLVR
jgi:hypothetical protein